MGQANGLCESKRKGTRTLFRVPESWFKRGRLCCGFCRALFRGGCSLFSCLARLAAEFLLYGLAHLLNIHAVPLGSCGQHIGIALGCLIYKLQQGYLDQQLRKHGLVGLPQQFGDGLLHLRIGDSLSVFSISLCRRANISFRRGSSLFSSAVATKARSARSSGEPMRLSTSAKVRCRTVVSSFCRSSSLRRCSRSFADLLRVRGVAFGKVNRAIRIGAHLYDMAAFRAVHHNGLSSFACTASDRARAVLWTCRSWLRDSAQRSGCVRARHRCRVFRIRS